METPGIFWILQEMETPGPPFKYLKLVMLSFNWHPQIPIENCSAVSTTYIVFWLHNRAKFSFMENSFLFFVRQRIKNLLFVGNNTRLILIWIIMDLNNLICMLVRVYLMSDRNFKVDFGDVLFRMKWYWFLCLGSVGIFNKEVGL